MDRVTAIFSLWYT